MALSSRNGFVICSSSVLPPVSEKRSTRVLPAAKATTLSGSQARIEKREAECPGSPLSRSCGSGSTLVLLWPRQQGAPVRARPARSTRAAGRLPAGRTGRTIRRSTSFYSNAVRICQILLDVRKCFVVCTEEDRKGSEEVESLGSKSVRWHNRTFRETGSAAKMHLMMMMMH